MKAFRVRPAEGVSYRQLVGYYLLVSLTISVFVFVNATQSTVIQRVLAADVGQLHLSMHMTLMITFQHIDNRLCHPLINHGMYTCVCVYTHVSQLTTGQATQHARAYNIGATA